MELINKAVKNNPRKFPTGYYFELDAEEKRELVEKIHWFDSLIAMRHPYYFVMRDKSPANDNVADKFE